MKQKKRNLQKKNSALSAQKPLTRKEKRKQGRKEKKQRKDAFLRQKFAPAAGAGAGAGAEMEAEVHSPKQKSPGAPSVEAQRERAAVKRKRDEEQQRRKQLRLANEEEERNLQQLEKQLKLKKKGKGKKSGMEKEFEEDGLDFLLEVCQPEGDAAKDVLEEDEDDDEVENEGETMDDFELEDDLAENKDDEEEEDEGEDDEEDDEEDEGEDSNEGDDRDDESNSDDDDDDDDDNEEEEEEKGEKKDTGIWEDIYGRQRDSEGNVLTGIGAKVTPSGAGSAGGKYIPPALRAKLASGSEDEKRREMLGRLRKKVQGLLNRLAASNLGGIARELEGVYAQHSRHDMNECLYRLLNDSLVLDNVVTPERLVMEHALLIGVLHINIGTEVGATILQSLVKRFHDLHSSDDGGGQSKELDNLLLVISHLYTFKVMHVDLIFDLLELVSKRFCVKDVELILLVLKAIGFSLRKDDPLKLKSLIGLIQQKSREGIGSDESAMDSRTKFMLEVLLAIKNNNVKKIPNYDQEHQQFLQKSMRQWLRPGSDPNNAVRVSLEDLVRADERGRWWIVGSAWAGKDSGGDRRATSAGEAVAPEAAAATSFSSELLELARKMRMTTDIRKSIFCTLMSAEDYMDAFEKLLKLQSRGSQKEREVAFVLLDCCLHEQRFNPYYAQLAVKLAGFERKYRMAAQFSLWDKIKALKDVDAKRRRLHVNNLARYAAYLIAEEALSVACLKVIEFADLDKTYVKFLKLVLTLLLQQEQEKCKKTFQTVSGYPKLKMLREGLCLFMRHFMLKDVKKLESVEERKEQKRRLDLAEAALMSKSL